MTAVPNRILEALPHAEVRSTSHNSSGHGAPNACGQASTAALGKALGRCTVTRYETQRSVLRAPRLDASALGPHVGLDNLTLAEPAPSTRRGSAAPGQTRQAHAHAPGRGRNRKEERKGLCACRHALCPASPESSGRWPSPPGHRGASARRRRCRPRPPQKLCASMHTHTHTGPSGGLAARLQHLHLRLLALLKPRGVRCRLFRCAPLCWALGLAAPAGARPKPRASERRAALPFSRLAAWLPKAPAGRLARHRKPPSACSKPFKLPTRL